MGNIHLIEPGTDVLKLNTRRPPIKIQWWWFVIVFLAALALFAFLRVGSPAKAAEATPDYHGDFTRTPTPLGAPTSTATPTASPTALLDGVQLPGLATPAECKPVVQVKEVQVTRVVQVPGQCNPSTIIQTKVVEITREVVITATLGPSSTPEATQTPWIIEVTRIVTETPTPTPTEILTATPTATGTLVLPTPRDLKRITPPPGHK